MASKLAKLAGVLSLAALAWTAAPALSLSPYVPEPVEFDQALPEFARLPHGRLELRSGRGGAEGPVRFRSPVIEAPKRFDAVGIPGEPQHLELRVRESAGAWSAWIEAVDNDPVWAGGAEELQIRSREGVPDGALHYVNVSGDATPADRALNALRGALNTAVIEVASVTPAFAQPPQPDIRARSLWDPDGDCEPRTRPAYGEVKAATLHHTVNANDYASGDTARMILAICLFHRNGNKWNDIGYNAVVDRFGRVWEGREGGIGRAVVGAHNQGFNSTTTGIASLGTHSDVSITQPAMRGLVRYLAWKLAHHGVSAIGRTQVVSTGGEVNRYENGEKVWIKRIIGHRRTNETSCPGDALYSELAKIRRRTQRQIVQHGGAREPEPEPEPTPPNGGVIP